MEIREYERIQQELTDLADYLKLKNKGLYGKKSDEYKEAVLACKSVLSRYKPEGTEK